MSGGYSSADRQYNILHSMHETAQTAPLHVVRNVFFSRYIEGMNAGSCKPIMAINLDHSADVFVSNLRKICSGFANDLNFQERENIKTEIKELLQKEGTPYQKIGYVLDWFKKWRAELLVKGYFRA